MSKTYDVKITAAVLVDGVLATPGKIVSLAENEAIALLNRGRCVLATEHDRPGAEVEQAPEDESEPRMGLVEAEGEPASKGSRRRRSRA